LNKQTLLSFLAYSHLVYFGACIYWIINESSDLDSWLHMSLACLLSTWWNTEDK